MKCLTYTEHILSMADQLFFYHDPVRGTFYIISYLLYTYYVLFIYMSHNSMIHADFFKYS